MTKYQQLIDEIVLMVNDDRLYTANEVEPLASQYRTAVKEVNRRLIFCEELIAKGYRSEVVQEADRSPNLLDSVAMLDFPDFELFRELINERQLQPLPPIRIDIASEVNDCYAGNNIVDRLLRQFRVASLSLAPIEERLGLLRQLHMIDNSNQGWADDVLVYEKARITQIQKEMAVAVKSENLNKLRKLFNELTSKEWIEKPPSSLAKSIESNIATFQFNEARNHALKLFHTIESSFQEQDAEGCKELLHSIEAVLESHSRALEADQIAFLDQVTSFISRYDQIQKNEQEYRYLTAQLDEALDQRESFEKVERIYAAIQRLEKPVHNDRVRRIHALKVESETQGRRKFVLIIAASVVLLIVSGTSGGLFYRSKARDRRVQQADVNLATMIQSMRLDEAEKELERLEKEDLAISKRPEIVKRATELAQANETEQKRRNEFEAIADQVTVIMRNAAGSFTDLSKADALVESAENLARDPAEKSQIDRFKTMIITARSNLQKKVDDQFLAVFKPLQERCESKDLSIESSNALLTDLLELKKRSKETRPELVNLIDPITSQLQRQIGEMELSKKEKTDRDRLIGNFSSVSNYLDGLKKFVQLQPRSRNAMQIKSILDNESQVWLDLAAFEALQDRVNSLKLSNLKTTEAQKNVQEWKSLAARLSFHPTIQNEPEVFKTISKMANRIDGQNNSLVSKIFGSEVLGHPLFQKKYMCDSSQNVYYLVSQPTSNTGFTTYSIRVYLDSEMRRLQAIGVEESKVDKSKSTSPGWENPIMLIANKYSDVFQKAEGKNWDFTAGRLIMEILSSSKIDDFQKVRCLKLILPIAMKGSLIIESVFSEHIKLIEQSNIDINGNWVNPFIGEAQNLRNKASNLLRKLPDLTETQNKLTKSIDSRVALNAGQVFTCAGALNKDDKDQWYLINSMNGEEIDGDLYILDKASSKPEFVKIGKKLGKRVDLDKTTNERVSEFKVVWVLTNSTTSESE